MKKLTIGQVNLLDPQSKAVLVALSHKMVKSHTMVSELINSSVDMSGNNDVFLDNVRAMMDSNPTFKETYDNTVVEDIMGVGDAFDYDINVFE